jgi:hypothetical protein
MKKIIVHYLHCLNFTKDVNILLYPFFFNPANDVYFIFGCIATAFQFYIFKGEDLLSYIEKKMEDSKYVMGQEIDRIPYKKTFYYYNGNNYTIIKDTFWILTILILIFYRKNHKYVKYTLAFMLLLVSCIKIPLLIKQ